MCKGALQGAVCTGVWVIAHECGHGGFSKWQVVNDAVGLVLHSCLLVPYFSWYASMHGGAKLAFEACAHAWPGGLDAA